MYSAAVSSKLDGLSSARGNRSSAIGMAMVMVVSSSLECTHLRLLRRRRLSLSLYTVVSWQPYNLLHFRNGSIK